ncbi:unnamed protein product [Brassica oleracea var. botrytis]
MSGVSSLTTNVCAGPTDNENEPAGETLQVMHQSRTC